MWLENWVLGDKSKKDFTYWQSIVPEEPDYMLGRVIDKQTAQRHMEKRDLLKPALQKYRQDHKVRDDYEDKWLIKDVCHDYIRQIQKISLVQLDPCPIMHLRTRPSKADSKFFLPLFQQHDIDPGLPLIMINPDNGEILVYDGNHRLQAACEANMDGYAAVVYWYDLKDYPDFYKAIRKTLA